MCASQVTVDLTHTHIEESEDRVEIAASGAASSGSDAARVLGEHAESLYGGSSMLPGVGVPLVPEAGKGSGRKGKDNKGKGHGKGKKEPTPHLGSFWHGRCSMHACMQQFAGSCAHACMLSCYSVARRCCMHDGAAKVAHRPTRGRTIDRPDAIQRPAAVQDVPHPAPQHEASE